MSGAGARERGRPAADRRTLLRGLAAGAAVAAGRDALAAGAARPAPGGAPRSAKRGVAYDLASPADVAALSPGVSWWYNWSPFPNPAVADVPGMAFVPMLWNGEFDAARVVAFLASRPSIRHLLVLNEPNLREQANHSPGQAAAIWPRFESVAARAGVAIVGPAITWGTQPGGEDPVAWMDAFVAAYRAANGGRAPRIDALAFHWYDYGLDAQLDRLARYGRPFWVTEMANWHAGDGPRIDTPERQAAQMDELVATCERRDDVHRYAWFTGRWPPDPHHTSLLGADGEPTALGRRYVSLPAGAAPRR